MDHEITARLKSELGELLDAYDVKIIADYSGSTVWPLVRSDTRSPPVSRHEAMRECAIGVVADVLPFDSNGVDLYTFADNTVNSRFNVSSVEEADEFFGSVRVGGGTPLFKALSAAFHDTDESGSAKPALYIVLFDGQPDSGTEGNIEQLIINRAGAQAAVCKELIVFIQFGDDSSGSRWLDHLDTGLTAAKEDIVFTVSHTDYGKYANFKEMIKAGLIDNRV